MTFRVWNSTTVTRSRRGVESRQDAVAPLEARRPRKPSWPLARPLWRVTESGLHTLLLVRLCASPSFSQERSTLLMRQLVAAAIERTLHQVHYDGRYKRLAYPGGDVPDHIGVCTDVIIRSYRKVGIDLQQAVHEDTVAAFSAYPRLWGHTQPDPNIDHRRVPNLQTFFQRQEAALPVTRDPRDSQPGDPVTWMLPGNLPHIGIVMDRRSADAQRHLIVHNVGSGPEIADVLFEFRITGHYRYAGSD